MLCICSDYNAFVQSVYTNVVNMHIATLVICWVVCLGYYWLLMRPYCVSAAPVCHQSNSLHQLMRNA
jgi:hypothetical protein